MPYYASEINAKKVISEMLTVDEKQHENNKSMWQVDHSRGGLLNFYLYNQATKHHSVNKLQM